MKKTYTYTQSAWLTSEFFPGKAICSADLGDGDNNAWQDVIIERSVSTDSGEVNYFVYFGGWDMPTCAGDVEAMYKNSEPEMGGDCKWHA